MLELRAPSGSGAKNPAARLLHCDWLAYSAREQPGRSTPGHETRHGSQRKASLLIKTLIARMYSSTFTGALCIWKWCTPEFMGPHFGTTIFPCIYLFFFKCLLLSTTFIIFIYCHYHVAGLYHRHVLWKEAQDEWMKKLTTAISACWMHVCVCY